MNLIFEEIQFSALNICSSRIHKRYVLQYLNTERQSFFFFLKVTDHIFLHKAALIEL